jgi:hypothetical protein
MEPIVGCCRKEWMCLCCVEVIVMNLALQGIFPSYLDADWHYFEHIQFKKTRTKMSLSTSSSSSYKFEQYRTFGGITVAPSHRIYQSILLDSLLIYRQSKSVIPTNPLNCVQQSEHASTSQKVGVMSPHDQISDSEIPTAASKWTKETLDLLNAKYESRSFTDFKFNELTLPDELQNGIIHII